jgi:hypothetical protein
MSRKSKPQNVGAAAPMTKLAVDRTIRSFEKSVHLLVVLFTK